MELFSKRDQNSILLFCKVLFSVLFVYPGWVVFHKEPDINKHQHVDTF